MTAADQQRLFAPNGTAVISDDGLYRYLLTRPVPSPLRWVNPVTFVMLNPSTADAALDDPTIRRCRSFAQRLGGTELRVVNLFAYRTPSPKALGQALAAGVDVIGPENDDRVSDEVLFGNGPVVAAWGARPSSIPADVFEARTRLIAAWIHQRKDRQPPPSGRVGSLGLTAEGHPRHPLYLKSDAPFDPWPPEV